MSNRKMRRTRESTVPASDVDSGVASRIAPPEMSSSAAWSGFDWYALQGDAVSALNAFSSVPDESSLAAQYNSLLLKELVHQDDSKAEALDVWMKRLEDTETAILSSKKPPLILSPRKIKRNEFLLAYNRALIHYGMGDFKTCLHICAEKLSSVFVVAPGGPPVSDELDFVTCHLVFLYFECLLSFGVGRNEGLDKVVASTLSDLKLTQMPSVPKMLEWLESVTTDKEPYIKFLIPVYRSRLALSEFDPSDRMLRVDGHVRSARKDMKMAMEIFQNKLRPAFGMSLVGGGTGGQSIPETDSVTSSINSGEEKGGTSTNEPHSSAPSSVVLQKLNQSALSLKAHLEQLKGNTKKSLILCSEAAAATPLDEDGFAPLHSNNLAVVYETNNGRHLALHALAKALHAKSSNDHQTGESVQLRTLSNVVCMDGTVRSDPTLSILYNAAICGLRARKYVSAYECMVTCILQSEVFRHRPGCWLRLAEACLGIHAELKQQHSSSNLFSTIEVDGTPHGIVVEPNAFCPDVLNSSEVLVAAMGSPEDLEQVKRSPLLRARASLQHAIQHGDGLESDSLTAARLSFCYVELAFGHYRNALALAKELLSLMEATLFKMNDGPECVRRLRRRQIATASMYAAEASCALGDMNGALGFLSFDGTDDAFDNLAAKLSGVSLEMVAMNNAAKDRFVKAQIMVRSSACCVNAASGNVPAAKQIGQFITSMEEKYVSTMEGSSARRALIYALLRDRDQSSALSILLS